MFFLFLSTVLGSFIAPLQTKKVKFLFQHPITYQMGARVLTDPVNVYFLYYGNFSLSQRETLEGFIKVVDQTAWWNITRGYYYQRNSTTPKVYVDGTVNFGGATTDAYSKGKYLSGDMVPQLIQKHIEAKNLPEDRYGIYFFLSDGSVKERIRDEYGKAYFCERYCGYHITWRMPSGLRIPYAFVGNPASCMSGCAPNQNRKRSPNGDLTIDAMISTIAHELTEAVTDPNSDYTRAWNDDKGLENADKCNSLYGLTRNSESGFYNVEVGDKRYLIQQNWSVDLQKCVSQ